AGAAAAGGGAAPAGGATVPATSRRGTPSRRNAAVSATVPETSVASRRPEAAPAGPYAVRYHRPAASDGRCTTARAGIHPGRPAALKNAPGGGTGAVPRPKAPE